MTTRTVTNITPLHTEVFNAMTSGDYGNFALFSCFVNGAPASCIVAVTEEGDRILITPLFVSITPEMILTDHDGVAA
jgi:hypothetical protein